MNYDPSLMVQLAELAEGIPSKSFLSIDQIDIPSRSREEVCDHLKLLIEEGLMLGEVQEADNDIFEILITRLTLKGHQFLEVARDQTKWKKLLRSLKSGAAFATREGFKLALAEGLKALFIASRL